MALRTVRLFLVLLLAGTFALPDRRLLAEGEAPTVTPPAGSHADITPETAALLGFVPGLGQFALGNKGTGAIQSLVFVGALFSGGALARKHGYINSEDRDVKFNLGDVLLGEALSRQGVLYPRNPYYALSPVPLPFETGLQRDQRLLRDGRIGEMNPLVEFGEYSRTNTRTSMADSYALLAQSTMFYSIYSSYRDAGRGRQGETLPDLMISPFRGDYLSSPHVLVPLVILGLSIHGSRMQTTLVNDRYMKDGTREFLTLYEPMNAAVAEEALFRGFMNDALSRRYGPFVAGAISGTAFGLAHMSNGLPASAVIPQTLAGYYFAFLQYKNHGDIREGIALHFWWDFLIFAAQFQAYRADSRNSLSPREVNFMPLNYTMRF